MILTINDGQLQLTSGKKTLHILYATFSLHPALPRVWSFAYFIAASRTNFYLNELSAHDRAAVKSALEIHLRHEPTKVSKSRIKRLRGLSKPQFRLRVDKFRAFYDVAESSVNILAIISKEETTRWLKEFGKT